MTPRSLVSFLCALFLACSLSMPQQATAQWHRITGVPAIPFVDLVEENGILYAITDSNRIYFSPGGETDWQYWTVGNPATLLTSLIFLNDLILVGTLENGVLTSSDNGASWQYSGLRGLHINDMALFQDVVYAATEAGVAYFDPNFHTWFFMNQSLPGYSMFVENIEASGQSLLITAGANGTFYRYDFQASEWKEEYYYGGLAPGLQIEDFKADGDTLWAVNGIRVIRSNDDGQSWVDDKTGTVPGYSRRFTVSNATNYCITNLGNGNAWIQSRSRSASAGTLWDTIDELVTGAYIFTLKTYQGRRYITRQDGLFTDAPVSAPNLPVKAKISWNVFPNPVPISGGLIDSEAPILEYRVFDLHGRQVSGGSCENMPCPFTPPLSPGSFLMWVRWASGASDVMPLVRE